MIHGRYIVTIFDVFSKKVRRTGDNTTLPRRARIALKVQNVSLLAFAGSKERGDAASSVTRPEPTVPSR